MTRLVLMILPAILLTVVFTIGIAAAADYNETHADLNVSKAVSSTGPYAIGDEVIIAQRIPISIVYGICQIRMTPHGLKRVFTGDCAGVFRISKKGFDGAIDIIVFHPPLKPGPKRPGKDDPTRSQHGPMVGSKRLPGPYHGPFRIPGHG